MAIGAPERADVVPDRDATVVARMRAAGAILLGKTNCPTYGGGIETDNPVHGRTNNPFDLDRTPGGSSGGEAAAIAARLLPVRARHRLGRQRRACPPTSAGSRRSSRPPAACPSPACSTTSARSARSPTRAPRSASLARAVEDVALLLARRRGPGRPRRRRRRAGLTAQPGGVAGLRVAMHTHTHLARPDRATIAAVHDAGAALRDAGATVEEAEPPRGGHELTIDVWRSYGDELSAEQLYALLRRWDAFRAEMLAWAADHDLVLCPVFPGPARRPRRHEPPRRDGPDELHHAPQPHRLARGHRPRRHLARRPADRRPARRPPLARRRRAERRARGRAAPSAAGEPPSRGPAAAAPA